MAILEDLDRRGILRRTPDGHVPGPRAARSASDRAMTARRVTGLVLAGGRSSRFGRDKLAERIDGRTLLDSAIDGVTPAATEILVVAAPDAAPDLPAGARLVHDPVAFEGPLAGVAAGLRAAHESIVLVVGGDMPTLVGAVIDSMLAALDAPGVEAVVLEHEGRARPLPDRHASRPGPRGGRRPPR